MKKNILLYTLLSFFMYVAPPNLRAQFIESTWAIGTVVDGQNKPIITMYKGFLEKGTNDAEYVRMHEVDWIVYCKYFNLIPLQYGYRMADRKIFIYDYANDKENLAFDFTLSAGEHFTTFNGTEWIVEEVRDTLVNISYMAEGEPSVKTLMTVRSADGVYTDQWLEDFGSFTNHFMIKSMEEMKNSHTLWMSLDYGYDIVREIHADPFFTHYSPWDGKELEDPTNDYVDYFYEDGILTVEDLRWRTYNNEYYCYYRVGDDIYNAFKWDVTGWSFMIVLKRKDTTIFRGIPEPQSGCYTIHFSLEEEPGESLLITLPAKNAVENSSVYDLQGRKLESTPSQGLYIQNGRKVMK